MESATKAEQSKALEHSIHDLDDLTRVFQLLFPGSELSYTSAGALAVTLHQLAAQAEQLQASQPQAMQQGRRSKKRKAGAARRTCWSSMHCGCQD